MIEYYPVNLDSYLNFLLDDVEENLDMARLINDLFLPQTITIEKWLKNVELGKNFLDCRPKLDLQGFFPTIDRVQEVDHRFLYVGEKELADLYCFFSKIECHTYEEAQAKFPRAYYVFNLRFFTRINSLIFDSLREYDFWKEQKVYVREIAPATFIKLKPYNAFNKRSGINEYLFPQIILEINKKEYHFFREGDLRQLLFLPGLSFVVFYLESNSVTFDDNGFMKVERKNDEPVVYHTEEDLLYTITNTHKKLRLYNQYICILLDLYIHYFKVFESWLISEVVGKPLKNA